VLMDGMTNRSFAAVFRAHARERRDEPAIVINTETLTFAELDLRAEAMARHLVGLGARSDDFVTIAEPNSFEFFVACLACWKIGAIPQPVSYRLPTHELEAIVELADSAVVVGMNHATRPSVPRGTILSGSSSDRLPDAISSSWKAPTSGGSTGQPKLIVSGDPSVLTEGIASLGSVAGAAPGETTVMPGPMYHNGPFIWSWMTLLLGGKVALLPRFDAVGTLDAVATHKANSLYLVPTMMQRIWKLPDEVKFSYDLSSVKRAFHLAEPCPKWLKEAWIDWIGPDNLWELYGGTEGQSFTVLDGNEWLEHPGSVGRPISGEMKICSEAGVDLSPGEVGEVWMRSTNRDTPTYRYIGAEPEARDGWECLGDIGWMDEEGYLYLADRRSDMILIGGANVFPAEIEAAIGSHPKVRSSAVIGLPDDDKTVRIHAIVEADDLDERELTEYLAGLLVIYKLPRSVEFVDEPLRDDAGKVRRSALRAERIDADGP